MDNRGFIRDINSLESTALIELWSINYQEDQKFYFHGGLNLDIQGVAQSIVFQNQVYRAMPCESSDFQVAADQKVTRPHLKILNTDKYISQILRRYDRLLNAKVTRQKVFVQNLDAINFPGGVNPYAVGDPSQAFILETWFVNRVVSENRVYVEFELSSSLDLENVNLPGRQILARNCSFCYRGQGCKYSGPPILNARDNGFTDSGNSPISSLVNKGAWQAGLSYNIGDYVSYPTKMVASRGVNPTDVTYVQAVFVCKQGHTSQVEQNPFVMSNLWERDDCSKRLSGCKARFNSTLPMGAYLGVSSYPGS